MRRVDDPHATIADIAIVIPLLGDLVPLRALLGRIAGWSRQPREIIVVDAAADKQLEALCERHGCLYRVSEACRGKQQDTGARAARADILWFVHADAMPGPSSIGEIAAAAARGTEGGHFRFRFSGTRMLRKTAIEWLTNLRVRLGGIPYGDQGIFVRRDIYLTCGGFPHQPLFEEVSLVRALRSRGRFRALSTPLEVSPRRWEQDGWLHRCLENRRLALAYGRGQTAHRLAGRYGLADRMPADAADGGRRT